MRIILLLLAAAYSLSGAQYFVSPAGSAQGAGTAQSPWDRATAFAYENLACNDVITVAEGVYDGPIQIQAPPCAMPEDGVFIENAVGQEVEHTISGSQTSSVISIMHNTARVIIRQNPLDPPLPYRHRISVTNAVRDWGLGWLACYPNCRPACIEDFGSHNQVIGILLLDCGDGIRSHANACGSTYRRNHIAFSGWDYLISGIPNTRNAAGNGIYANNANPTGCAFNKSFIGNIIHDGWETCFQWYGSDGTFIENGIIRDNVCLNNGHTAHDDAGGGLLTGKTTIGDIENNDISGVWLELIEDYERCAAFRFYLQPMTSSTISNNYIRGTSCPALSATLQMTGITAETNVIVGSKLLCGPLSKSCASVRLMVPVQAAGT